MLAEHGPGKAERLRKYETLLSDPTVQRGMSPIQTLEIRRRLVQTQVKHLELRYRYFRLRTQLELTLGTPICSSHSSPTTPR